MAKSNADIQKDKRAKEKALLDRIGAEKRREAHADCVESAG